MKKRGFTLAEVIVAMSIIGVIAAITMPMLGNIVPDKNKVKVLTTYKMVQDITAELLSSPSIYRKHRCQFEDYKNALQGDDNYLCVGLGDITPSFVPEYAGYENKEKYPLLLASKLELDGEPSVAADKIVTFTTTDNMNWTVTPSVNCLKDTVRSYNICGLDYVVSVDINGEAGPNKSNVRNADIYNFQVKYNGVVLGNDNLTRQYILSADKMNNKKEDYSQAGIE